MRACVYVCVQRSQHGLSGVGGGGFGAGVVGINSSPFIESNRRPKKAMCIYFFILHSLQRFLFFFTYLLYKIQSALRLACDNCFLELSPL